MNRDLVAGIIAGVIISLLWRGYTQSRGNARLIDIFAPFGRAAS